MSKQKTGRKNAEKGELPHISPGDNQEHAITFVGNVDNVLEEMKQIKEEQAEKQQNEISKQEQLSKFNRMNTGK